MTCSRWQELVAAHADGLLDPAAEHQLTVHLAECEACRMSLDELRQLVQRLKKDGRSDPGFSITDVVMDRIVHEQAIRLRRFGLMSQIVRVAVVAAVLFGVGLGFWHFLSGPVGGRLYAAELSAARKQVEDARTATWRIAYYQRFLGPAGAGSRWFRMQNFNQRYAYKAPGLYRCENLDKDGNVGFVSIEDQANRARLDINHKTKTATLSYQTESLHPPGGPFARYQELMEREDLRSLGTQDIAGRPANGFRFEMRNGLLGGSRSVDFWLDAAAKRLVQCQQPGGDLFNAAEIVRDRVWDLSSGETIEYEGKIFQCVRKGGQTKGHIVSEIAFDVALDDALFSLVPPAEYAFTAPEPPVISEKDVIEFLGIVADFYDQTFPDRMPQFAQNSTEDFERLERAQQAVHQKQAASSAEIKLVEAMDRWWRTGIPGPGPMHVFLTQQIAPGSWKYLGKGVKLGDKDGIVCWYRPKGSRSYRVVYGDLSVKTIKPEYLPLPVGR